ncbi:hypothetical protein T492DRAFT_532289 [Pavlovales sp. CCMP2436]|nr:hypothetical protein T492DRAFT_532289 [Pavlovales sp. CCMP2436]
MQQIGQNIEQAHDLGDWVMESRISQVQLDCGLKRAGFPVVLALTGPPTISPGRPPPPGLPSPGLSELSPGLPPDSALASSPGVRTKFQDGTCGASQNSASDSRTPVRESSPDVREFEISARSGGSGGGGGVSGGGGDGCGGGGEGDGSPAIRLSSGFGPALSLSLRMRPEFPNSASGESLEVYGDPGLWVKSLEVRVHAVEVRVETLLVETVLVTANALELPQLASRVRDLVTLLPGLSLSSGLFSVTGSTVTVSSFLVSRQPKIFLEEVQVSGVRLALSFKRSGGARLDSSALGLTGQAKDLVGLLRMLPSFSAGPIRLAPFTSSLTLEAPGALTARFGGHARSEVGRQVCVCNY